jgi:hypothetical protein
LFSTNWLWAEEKIMQKTIGLILVTLGLGLTAGFGAILSPGTRKAILTEGEAGFSDSYVESMQAEYCSSREKNKLPPADGCAGSPPLVPIEKASQLTRTELYAAQVDAISSNKEVLLIDVSQARVLYRIALKKSLKRWQAVDAAETQGPSARLEGWLGAGGAGFGLGLLLLAFGSWMCRKAGAVDGSGGGDEAADGPVDFGAMLGDVHDNISILLADMKSLEKPTVADLEGFKVRLEDVQKDAMARLCASGPSIQRRYGLHGMAALFSPLSAGERKLNRAWSALVDRHWPESLSSVEGALVDLTVARAEMGTLQASQAG